MWVTEVALDGVSIPLDDVLADVVIRHGRGSEIDDPPTASTLQLTLHEVTRELTSAFRVGVPITVEADGARRFTGTVTDASLDDERLTVIGVGMLATLSRFIIGAGVWPSETWSVRVQRAFTEAGLAPLLLLQRSSDFDPLLLARGTAEELPEPVTLYDYLQALADDVGAAIADTPDGKILVQQLSARAMDTTLTWEETPTDIAWNEADSSWQNASSIGALDPEYPLPLPGLSIDPSDVVYVPVWEMVDAVENVSTVGYGDQLAVTVTEAASVALYDERPGGVSTQLATLPDATFRAQERIARRAFPRWVIRSVPLLSGYTLVIGQQIFLSGFPAPSPFPSWNPILEGWTDTITGDVWTTELAVTDPLLSGATILWVQTPTDIAWNEVDPNCAWIEATTLDALTTTLEVKA